MHMFSSCSFLLPPMPLSFACCFSSDSACAISVLQCDGGSTWVSDTVPREGSETALVDKLLVPADDEAAPTWLARARDSDVSAFESVQEVLSEGAKFELGARDRTDVLPPECGSVSSGNAVGGESEQ